MSRLFAFGFGYSAQELALRLLERGWTVAGTARDEAKRDALRARGFEAAPFSGDSPNPEIDRLLLAHQRLRMVTPLRPGAPYTWV